MKKLVLILLLTVFLSACQSQSVGEKTASVQKTAIPTPAENTMTLTGRVLSSIDGKPYTNTAVQLAGVYRNNEGGAVFALDAARSPGSFTDDQGYFVIPGVIYDEFVIVVGNPDGNYYIVNENPNLARIYKSQKGEIQEVGDLKIDYVP